MIKPTVKQVVDELLELYEDLLVPFMKVRRDMPFPTEDRQETDTEHAFTLAVLAPTIAERLGLKLNENLIIKYAVVHDLVEAYAGDISVRHAESYQNKADKEHEAFLKIEKRFKASAPWIVNTVRAYENRTDAEARFVYATDKLMGSLTRLVDRGETWAEYYPETDGSGFHAVVERLRKKAEAYPELLELFDAVHNHLDAQWPGYLGVPPKNQ